MNIDQRARERQQRDAEQPDRRRCCNRPNAWNQPVSFSLATSWAAKPARTTGTAKTAAVAATAPDTAAT